MARVKVKQCSRIQNLRFHQTVQAKLLKMGVSLISETMLKNPKFKI